VKSLVTGAGGFVGRHLIEHLTAIGDDVVAVDRATGPDLLDQQGWIDRFTDQRPEVVYHLAGRSDVGASWQEPTATIATNVLGTTSVLEAARRAGSDRVVVISSADVYGPVGPDELPLTEDRQLRPRSPYGASKQAAEDVALQYQRGHGLDVVVVRPFNHIGPGQSPRFAAAAFAEQIAEAELSETGSPHSLRHGNLTARRDLTDVRDVVRAYRLLADKGQPGEIYNVCSHRAVAMSDLLDSLLTLTAAPVVPETDPSLLRPVEVPVLCGSFAKLQAATGWQPTIELGQTLRDVLDDARDRRRGRLPAPHGTTH
jgi:GDP-4-dehydro-6-deoxy-D-mannose reductase